VRGFPTFLFSNADGGRELVYGARPYEHFVTAVKAFEARCGVCSFAHVTPRPVPRAGLVVSGGSGCGVGHHACPGVGAIAESRKERRAHGREYAEREPMEEEMMLFDRLGSHTHTTFKPAARTCSCGITFEPRITMSA
jgi:hypothetical protein